VQLVGHLSKKFGRQAAQRIVEEHYRLNERNIRSTLDEHLRDFSTAWDGMCKKLVSELSAAEKEAFNRLKTEHQREGFLIVRAFAGATDHKKQRDFAISQASLADRLIVTGPGAGDVIRKLCKEEIIAPTQDYVRHKHSARFRWVLPHPTDRATSSTSSPPGLDSLSAPLLTGAQKDMPQLPQVAGAFEAK
jgi:hypothetical protein